MPTSCSRTVMSDHLSRAVPAYGNPRYTGVGGGVVRSVNESFESAQAGVVPYMSWTEVDEDLFAENETDWVADWEVLDETVVKRGRPKKSD